MSAGGKRLGSRAPPVQDDRAGWRTLEYFALVRALIAGALILSAVVAGSESDWRGMPIASVSMVYFALVAASAFATFYLRRGFLAQVVAQVALDFIFVSVLLLSTEIATATILYLLPLTGAALMLPAVAVYAVSSLAAFVLLADAVRHLLRFDAIGNTFFQAGLSGAVLFAVAALLQFMATRLAQQERLAQSRGRMIQGQLEINRLVIAEMEQGVIVVDATTRVRANNRAARELLGLGGDAQLTGRLLADFPAFGMLTAAFQRWVTVAQTGAQQDREFILTLPEVRLRVRFARPRTTDSAEFAIFLEDERRVEDRAQQLKLAAMGRLTASITHEIRNPLGAIGHAAQLLLEEVREPTSLRLAQIVNDNTRRLNRLVEDVLRVARRDLPSGEEIDDIDLETFLSAWVREFILERKLDGAMIRLDVNAVRVRFEETQLRQVLFNLVENAVRYASGRPHSVEILAQPLMADARAVAQLWVLDDGPGVSEAMQSNLFEPFFTSEGRGTGLGLYMAREFCALNQARLTYARYRERDALDGAPRRGFRIEFGRRLDFLGAPTQALDTIEVR